jgi:hypothetical protein
MSDEHWFERMGEATDDVTQERAPARLKSRVYSALVARMAESGSLLDLAETKAAGARLCVFETALTMLPLAGEIPSMNPCRVCHARVLGERMVHAPIFWPGCPYSEFHNG